MNLHTLEEVFRSNIEERNCESGGKVYKIPHEDDTFIYFVTSPSDDSNRICPICLTKNIAAWENEHFVPTAQTRMLIRTCLVKTTGGRYFYTNHKCNWKEKNLLGTAWRPRKDNKAITCPLCKYKG